MKALPPEVDRFLHEHIDSVEHLEVLLLFARSPERGWSATELAETLYSHPSSIKLRLTRLVGQGLVGEIEEGCYKYAPGTDELHRTVLRVSECYHERRVAVTTLIASKPLENVRAFSDAFRIRRTKEE